MCIGTWFEFYRNVEACISIEPMLELTDDFNVNLTYVNITDILYSQNEDVLYQCSRWMHHVTLLFLQKTRRWTLLRWSSRVAWGSVLRSTPALAAGLDLMMASLSLTTSCLQCWQYFSASLWRDGLPFCTMWVMLQKVSSIVDWLDNIYNNHRLSLLTYTAAQKIGMSTICYAF